VRRQRLSPERVRRDVEAELNRLWHTVEDPYAAYLELLEEIRNEQPACTQ
jgi:hypothetical protein